MTEMLATAQWVTEASDFLTSNWAKLLGLLGGTSGVIAILTFIAKLILMKVQSKTNKKNNIPVMEKVLLLESQIKALKDTLKDDLIKLLGEQVTGYITELDGKLEALMLKAQEQRKLIVDQIIAKEEELKTLAEEGEKKAEEIEAFYEETKAEAEQLVEEEILPEIEESTTEIIEDCENVSHETKTIVKKVYANEE